MLIKKSELPSVRGLVGASTAAIRHNAQIAFSSTVSKALTERTIGVVDWNEKTRELSILALASVPKGLSAEDCITISYSKKQGGAYFAAAGLLQKIGYDYKTAGNQNFPAAMATLALDMKTGSLVVGKGAENAVVFSIPAETPTPKPVKARKARKQASAEAGSTQDATQGTKTEEGEELELEPA